jgi:MFS family permease
MFWIPFISFWGRAPVLFYLILAGTTMTLATALVADFNSYYATHALMGFLYGGSQTLGLAYIQDMFYLHQHSRKIGIWAAMLQAGPLTGALFAYFILAGTGGWRPMYWMFLGMSSLLLVMVVVFVDEPWYRRDLPVEDQPARGPRLLRLFGVWQWRAHSGYFATVRNAYERMMFLLIKPIMLPILIFLRVSLTPTV